MQTIVGEVDRDVHHHHASAAPPTPPPKAGGGALTLVFAFGGNHFGNLGTGDDKGQAHPRHIPTLAGKGVVDVACGKDHSAALTATGELYMWGRGSNGRLGLNNAAHYQLIPRALPAKIAFNSVTCGGFHTLAIATGGVPYAWGCNASGQLGLGHRVDATSPAQVVGPGAAPQLVRVVDVGAGLATSAFACDDGMLYTCGSNECGALGIGICPTPDNLHDEGDNCYARPQPVRFPTREDCLTLTGALQHSSSASLAGATLLGRDRTRSHVSAPAHLLNAAIKIQSRVRGNSARRRSTGLGKPMKVARGGIVCGDFFMLALAEDRRGQCVIFTWGFGGCGALGHGDLDDRYEPTLVQGLRSKEVLSASAGAGHVAVVVRVRKIGQTLVYTWGAGASGQLGIGALSAPQKRGTLPESSATKDSGGGGGGSPDKKKPKTLSRKASDLDLLDNEEESEAPAGPLEVVRSPRLVESLNDKSVEVVSCGDAHTSALTADGKVFVWGCNRWFQLGLPSRRVPYKLWSPQQTRVAARGIGQRRVGAVVCGGRHTLVVLRQTGKKRETSDVGSTISHMLGWEQ